MTLPSLAQLIHSTLLPEGLANTAVAENMLRAFHGMMIFDVLTLTKFSAENWKELPLGIRVLIQPAVMQQVNGTAPITTYISLSRYFFVGGVLRLCVFFLLV